MKIHCEIILLYQQLDHLEHIQFMEIIRKDLTKYSNRLTEDVSMIIYKNEDVRRLLTRNKVGKRRLT